MKVKDISLMSIMLSILIITSKISIDLVIISMTLQTFSVILISLILKWKRSFIVILVYMLMGLIGIPVFSNGGGFFYVLKPSFGFILGFLLSTLIVGSKPFENKKISYFIKAIIGLAIIDIIGLIYMSLILNLYMDLSYSFIKILKIGLLPFVIKDIFSVTLASLVALRVNNEIYLKEVEAQRVTL